MDPMSDQNDPEIQTVLDMPLSEFEASKRTVAAFEKLGVTSVRQLLATPSRTFLNAAGDFRSLVEMLDMLADMGLTGRGWPLEVHIPPEER
jgi:hypothetical protein